jgi:hypothetical protein
MQQTMQMQWQWYLFSKATTHFVRVLEADVWSFANNVVDYASSSCSYVMSVNLKSFVYSGLYRRAMRRGGVRKINTRDDKIPKSSTKRREKINNDIRTLRMLMASSNGTVLSSVIFYSDLF